MPGTINPNPVHPEFPPGVLDWAPEASVDRNLQPILDALSPYLERPEVHNVLEIASGYGRHIASWARAFPSKSFTPSDRDERLLLRIQRETSGLANVQEAQMLDLSKKSDWQALQRDERRFDAVVANNLVHITPWEVTESLFQHLPSIFPPVAQQAILAMYGPYLDGSGHFASKGDQVFDESIRARDPRFGLRDVAKVAELARLAGLSLCARVPMPSGNWLIVYSRQPLL